jgi:hypothetical protein
MDVGLVCPALDRRAAGALRQPLIVGRCPKVDHGYH